MKLKLFIGMMMAGLFITSLVYADSYGSNGGNASSAPAMNGVSPPPAQNGGAMNSVSPPAQSGGGMNGVNPPPQSNGVSNGSSGMSGGAMMNNPPPSQHDSSPSDQGSSDTATGDDDY